MLNERCIFNEIKRNDNITKQLSEMGLTTIRRLDYQKEVEIKLLALTVTKTQYIPPTNHPWRSFQFSKKQEKIKV